MMAGSSTGSNQRPDTLMQDRISQIDENLLHRMAGPYIGATTRLTYCIKKCLIPTTRRRAVRTGSGIVGLASYCGVIDDEKAG